MCGANDAMCLHGECVVEAAVEFCRCDAMYSGSQCAFRAKLMYRELPVACALILLLLGFSVLAGSKSLSWLRFSDAVQDPFAFPRKCKSLAQQSFGSQLRRGKWNEPTRMGLPTKPAKGHLVENFLIVFVVIMELLQWVQLTALSFLPVVPWPKASRDVAETLRLSLLYPLWSHLQPSQFPRLVLYVSMLFVPGVLLLACVIGAKRFPLFKPQPKHSPAEDFCTLVLRFYSEWITLPVMIGLLLPLECGVIGYTKTEGPGMTLPNLNSSCFSLWQGVMAAAGICMLLVFCLTSSAIVFQLNCESSPPEPTLWTNVRYTRVVHALKAPLAMSVVGSVNANALLLCGSCILISLVLAIMNAKLKPCVHSLVRTAVNGLRLAGSVLALWSSLLALATTLIDDPGTTMVYEVWSLGAIAISAISFPGLLLYHTKDLWHRLATAGSASPAIAGKGGKEVATSRVGLPKIMPERRSSAAEKQRSRSKRDK